MWGIVEAMRRMVGQLHDHRTRDPRSAIEECIHANGSEAVTLTSWWMRAAGADLYFFLRERGLWFGPAVRHAAARGVDPTTRAEGAAVSARPEANSAQCRVDGGHA